MAHKSGLWASCALAATALAGSLAPGRAVCQSEQCKAYADRLLGSMSPNHKDLDPCTDWMQLVCGGYMANPAYAQDTTPMALMAHDAEREKQAIISGAYPGIANISDFVDAFDSRADRDNFDLMKTTMNQCMDMESRRSAGIQPLRDLIAELVATFPAETDRPEGAAGAVIGTGDAALHRTAEFVYRTDTVLPVRLTTVMDLSGRPEIEGLRAVAVSYPARLTLEPADYSVDSKVDQWKALMKAKFKSLWLGNDKAADIKAARLAGQVAQMEKQLMAAIIRVAAINNTAPPAITFKTLDQVSAMLPQLDLGRLVRSLSASGGGAAPKLIKCTGASYLTDAAAVFARTKRETLHAWFVWQIYRRYEQHVMETAPADQVSADRISAAIIFGPDPTEVDRPSKHDDPGCLVSQAEDRGGRGPPPPPPGGHDEMRVRRAACFASASRRFPDVISRFYVTRRFSGYAKELGDRIVHELRDAYLERVNATAWMDGRTKAVALRKLDKMRQMVGFQGAAPHQPGLFNTTEVRAVYRSINTTGDYFWDEVEFARWEIRAMFGRLARGWTTATDSGLKSFTVNAAMWIPANTIVLPAAIMQPPTFEAALPAYVNYGSFGMIVGHELTHVLDVRGRQVDDSETARNWWSRSAADAYQRRQQCYVNQTVAELLPRYGRILAGQGPAPAFFPNQAQAQALQTPSDEDGAAASSARPVPLGERWSQEIVADSEGLSVALSAWQSRRELLRQGGTRADREALRREDAALPGFEAFTPEQTFFLAAGQFFCQKTTVDKLRHTILQSTDPHPMPALRVMAPVLNSRGWLEAFSCKPKEPQCTLYG